VNDHLRMSPNREEGLLDPTLTHSVIAAFFDVHRVLGFGFREYIYALALERELLARGHRVNREVAVMVYYRGQPLAWQVLDMIIDEKLVLEIKSAEQLQHSAAPQLLGYLCATNMEVGLVLHFGREPKFSRVICENRFKRHRNGEQRSGGH
jgi:GxxExxY protein